MERLCHTQRGGEHRQFRLKERGPQRERGSQKPGEREERKENQARLRKPAKTQRPIQRGPQQRRRQRRKEKSGHIGDLTKQTTTGVVEVSINIC